MKELNNSISWELHGKTEGKDFVALMYIGVYLGIGVQKEVFINVHEDLKKNKFYGSVSKYFFSDVDETEYYSEKDLIKSIIDNRSTYIDLFKNHCFA